MKKFIIIVALIILFIIATSFKKVFVPKAIIHYGDNQTLLLHNNNVANQESWQTSCGTFAIINFWDPKTRDLFSVFAEIKQTDSTKDYYEIRPPITSNRYDWWYVEDMRMIIDSENFGFQMKNSLTGDSIYYSYNCFLKECGM